MKIINNIKKYSKSFGFTLVAIGTISTVLGISLFTGGGMHGVGIPDSSQNSKTVQWTRVPMGYLNFQGTGELIAWLKLMDIINQNENSITFSSYLQIVKDNSIRNEIQSKINLEKQKLDSLTSNGAVGVANQLKIRTSIDLMENLLLSKSMYQLSITGIVILPIGAIILFIGIYFACSGIRKDKRETKEFLNSLEKLDKNKLK